MGCNSCGGYNKYEGSHFGKVIWSRYASTSELGDRYDDFATKQMEIFSLKANYQIANKQFIWRLTVRNVH
jgi:iron complex outermembrane receptor protein